MPSRRALAQVAGGAGTEAAAAAAAAASAEEGGGGRAGGGSGWRCLGGERGWWRHAVGALGRWGAALSSSGLDRPPHAVYVWLVLARVPGGGAEAVACVSPSRPQRGSQPSHHTRRGGLASPGDSPCPVPHSSPPAPRPAFVIPVSPLPHLAASRGAGRGGAVARRGGGARARARARCRPARAALKECRYVCVRWGPGRGWLLVSCGRRAFSAPNEKGGRDFGSTQKRRVSSLARWLLGWRRLLSTHTHTQAGGRRASTPPLPASHRPQCAPPRLPVHSLPAGCVGAPPALHALPPPPCAPPLALW